MNGMNTPGDNAQQQEAGALDNVMSLDSTAPQFSDVVGDWQDGQEYDVKARIRQVSPGKYEVLTLAETESAPEPKPEVAEENESEYPNPAVARM